MMQLPKYAVDLLMAAKSVAAPAVNASPGVLDDSLQQLATAVRAFEAGMPLVDGVIQEGAGQTPRQVLSELLAEYRAGTRGLPTYGELAAIIGRYDDRHAAINAAPCPSIFDVITNTEGKGGGTVHVRADGTPMAFDDAPTTAEAIETAARLCDEQASEWDSDAVVSNKNYAAHCAALIRAMSQRSCP